jgi:potassium efflux system protein
VIYSMLAIEVLVWVLANADPSDLWARVLLLTAGAAGLFVEVWWFERRKIAPYLPQAFRWIAVPARVIGVILGISVVANVAGAVGLASTLTSAVFHPAFFALTLYLAVKSIESAVTLAILLPQVRLPHFIAHNRLVVQRRLGRFLRVAAVLIWAWYTLNTFVLFRAVWSGFLGWLTRKWAIGNANVSIADALLFFIVLWIATLLSRFVRFVLREDVLPRLPLRRGIPETILLLVNYGIMAVGFVLALASLGLEVGQFALLAGAFGVGLGFGLQTIVNNFVSGLILMFERPIQIGDVVEVGALMGVVQHIGIRASVIRTFAGAEVIVPNGTLVSEQVINWTLSDSFRRIEVKVGAAYGTDPAVVIAALQRACEGDPRIASQPAPAALFMGFGESSLDFELRAWTSSDDWFVLSSDIKVRVNAELAKAGVTIPFPQRDIHVRTMTAPEGAAPTAPPRAAK